MSDSEHELRSFGRRRGRKPSARQSALLRDDLPRLTFDPAAPPEGFAQTWLEIGFGGGEHLLWQARHNPTVALIGCEPFEDGVIKVLTSITEDGLKNVRLHMGDALEVIERLPDASLSRVYLLHPDPWPKARHAKRRMMNHGPLDLIAAKLKPGGEFRFGTDHPVYLRHALMVMRRHRDLFEWLCDKPADFQRRPGGWPETRYEAKARNVYGHEVWYFRFRRK
jgi:tRNA (guanine-N7-)-methyltransferase